MNAKMIIDEVKKSNSDYPDSVSVKDSITILQQCLEHIKLELINTDEDILIPGFGRFRVKHVEDRDRNKIKRLIFIPQNK